MDTAKNVPMPVRFTVRVYGFLTNDKNEVLVSHETINGMDITKLPGGGVEFGEGPREALEREIREELGIGVETRDLIYATDFFVQSALDPEEQVIGIYYLVTSEEFGKVELGERKDQFRGKETRVRREWIAVKELSEEDFTFEMDKAAVRGFLKKQWD